MKKLVKIGIELRVKQKFFDNIEGEINGIRDWMADYIMGKIDEIIVVDAEDKLYKKLSSYLAKEYSKSDLWLYPQQLINLGIIKAYCYGESGLAIPKNEKVLSLLLPKFTEKFNVSFVKMEKEELFEMLEERALPHYSRKNWNFYKIIVIE